MLEAALWYGDGRGWEVAPGTYVVPHGIAPAIPAASIAPSAACSTAYRPAPALNCSCARVGCPAPGAHPAHDDWMSEATTDPDRIRQWWAASPQASILLPTGRRFDVIDLPEPAGCLALARLERAGVAIGPVVATSARRMLFFVLPGGREKAPGILARLGWSAGQLDLRCHGAGAYILAPPSSEGPAGPVYWARPPTDANWWLPAARDLLCAIAYACRRTPGSRPPLAAPSRG
jgi:hypothetical protein